MANVLAKLCARHGTVCLYEAEVDESLGQARKRKFDELTECNDSYPQLYELLARGSDSEAATMLRSIRSGESLDSILHSNNLHWHFEQKIHTDFLFAAIQSTTPLDALLDLAARAFSKSFRLRLPDREAYEPLRNCIITLESLSGILEGYTLETS